MLSVIVSGGQTGADRAALDIALAWGLKTGGWVPKGRQAEDGKLHDIYVNMEETESTSVEVRTSLNVQNSDATLIISHGNLMKGSLLTQSEANKFKKPCMHIDLSAQTLSEAVYFCSAWIGEVRPPRLNIAGPRQSEDNAIYGDTYSLLDHVFRKIFIDRCVPQNHIAIATTLYTEALCNFRHWDQIRWVTPFWFVTLIAGTFSAYIGFNGSSKEFAAACIFTLIGFLGLFCWKLQCNLIKYHVTSLNTYFHKINTLYLTDHEKNIFKINMLPFNFKEKKVSSLTADIAFKNRYKLNSTATEIMILSALMLASGSFLIVAVIIVRAITSCF